MKVGGKRRKYERPSLFALCFAIFMLLRSAELSAFVPLYFLMAAALTAMIVLLLKPVIDRVSFKCPRCGGSMEKSNTQVAFGGAENMEGGRDFPPLLMEIHRCSSCGNEFRTLYKRSRKRLTKEERGELAVGTAVFDYLHSRHGAVNYADIPIVIPKRTSVYRYNAVCREMASIIERQNLDNGFGRNGIKFRIKE